MEPTITQNSALFLAYRERAAQASRQNSLREMVAKMQRASIRTRRDREHRDIPTLLRRSRQGAV